MESICDSYKNDPQFKETLRLIGDFWTLRIVAVLENEDLRFCGIERALGDSNPATLTARLKKLEHSHLHHFYDHKSYQSQLNLQNINH